MDEQWKPDLFDRKLPQLVYELELERDEEKAKAKEATQTAVLVSIVSFILAVILSVGAFLIADRMPENERLTGIITQITKKISGSDNATGALESDIEKKVEERQMTDPEIKSDESEIRQDTAEADTSRDGDIQPDSREDKSTEKKQDDVASEDSNDRVDPTEKVKANVHKTKSIHYNKKTKALSLELDGKCYLFPVTGTKLMKNGWTMVDEASDPNDESITAKTLFDKSGSTVFIYTDSDTGESDKMEVVFANKKTSFMGLTLNSKPKVVKKIFKKAHKIKKDGYRKGNGRILYAFGKYVVGVNYANGTAFSVSLEKGDIDG